MKSGQVNHWLTLAANLGVIVGIGFLVLEMQQNREIAIAQVRFEYAAAWRTIDESRQDEAFAATLAKSVESPESLSLHDFIQLDAYYWGVIDQMLSAQTASNSGIRDGSFEEAARQVGAIYFSNDFARSWWRQVRSIWSFPVGKDFQKTMDDAIVGESLGGLRKIHEEIQRDLSMRSETPIE